MSLLGNRNKIRTVDFDAVKMSWSISTATPITALTLHHLVLALFIRYISEQAALHIYQHISTFRTLHYPDATNILVYSMVAIT